MRYSLKSERTDKGDCLHLEAVGDDRKKYHCWIEKWDDGWVAQECSDTGSGGIIADKLPTRVDAIDAVIDFLREHGGEATIDDEK